MNTIHIGWDGPFTMAEVKKLNGLHDFGVYQVYGPSPIYCRVELLYIGQAYGRPFAIRIPEHIGWIEYCTRDSSQTSFYVGRLMGNETPENSVWEREIGLAEGLLIYAHYPAYNSQKDSAPRQPEFNDLRVFNWGKYRDLMPEISGARLGTMPDLKFYGNLDTNLDKSLQQQLYQARF
jgi:hypothetical protein